MRNSRILQLLAGAFSVLITSSVSAEMHRWTNTEGKSIHAEFAGFEDHRRMVVLRLENGSTIQYPLYRLSTKSREQLKRLAPVGLEEKVRQIDLSSSISSPSPLSDEAFLQDSFLRLLGRPPKASEISVFVHDPASKRRSNLIDRLIGSREFAVHLVGSFESVLGLVPFTGNEVPFPECHRETGNRHLLAARERSWSGLNSGPYREWLVDEVHDNRPWSEIIHQLIVASGQYPETPSVGYLAAQLGPELFDPSHLFTAFLGVEITCARCHDHPFVEVDQLDYYRIAAFFGTPSDLSVFDRAQGKVILADHEFRHPTILPQDYRGENGNPGLAVKPGVYFGRAIRSDIEESYREEFAVWLTDESNPRFTLNLVNRLWQKYFGTARIDPVFNLPGIIDEAITDLSLLESLIILMKDENYQVKDFLRIVLLAEESARSSGD